LRSRKNVVKVDIKNFIKCKFKLKKLPHSYYNQNLISQVSFKKKLVKIKTSFLNHVSTRLQYPKEFSELFFCGNRRRKSRKFKKKIFFYYLEKDLKHYFIDKNINLKLRDINVLLLEDERIHE
jgi:hypothetical protein